jgi:predicted transposase YbfD/YdcC
VLTARAVESKGNEITAKKADYLLALKENQGSLYADVAELSADPALASTCGECRRIEAGHGRIEERLARAADAAWLAEPHPRWTGLRSIAAISVTRTDKKTGAISTATRLYISSLPSDPALLLKACRSHWSIENNLHWRLDVTFREDECRIRKDYAAINLARMRHAALSILNRDPSKIPIKRKRLKAAINPQFRTALLAC